MKKISRRNFLKASGAGCAFTLMSAGMNLTGAQRAYADDAASTASKTYTADECYAEGYEVCVNIESEGAVLLKNNSCLPLAESTKVTILGAMSYNYVEGGTGSAGGADDANTVIMRDAFVEAGLDVNDGAWSWLESQCGGSRGVNDNDPGLGADGTAAGWTSYTAIHEFAADVYAGAKSDLCAEGYTDYAIVTFSRSGAEGASPSMDYDGDGSTLTGTTYFELDQNEKDLLAFCKTNFTHTIVLINSAAPMELGFIDSADYNVDACLWIGHPGEAGVVGVGTLLTGRSNPSGRLVDTYAYDMTTNPTYYNTDDNKYANVHLYGGAFSAECAAQYKLRPDDGGLHGFLHHSVRSVYFDAETVCGRHYVGWCEGMTLAQVMAASHKIVIGLMSGTSADGVDAALVAIDGHGMDTRVYPKAYVSIPFPAEVREAVLRTAGGETGGSREICMLSARLGQLYLEACEAVCARGGVSPAEVALVGCHGQTVYHQPAAEPYLGGSVRSTLQIGDPSLICEKMHTVAVSDFRVRDMAAGGQGAPLVPYSEYLLYRSADMNIALQNIGGIGNITYLPAGGRLEDTVAFDTGPGNMLLDAVTAQLTHGAQRYDAGGALAARFSCSQALLELLLQDPYLGKKPPKTTGREYYGEAFLQRCRSEAAARGLSDGVLLRTLTRYTAAAVAAAMPFLPARPDRLIVGGGGSYNRTLLADLRDCLPGTQVLTNEDLGFNGDAKEAVAFAILANEAVSGGCNNVPAATGAAHPVVMGKISQ